MDQGMNWAGDTAEWFCLARHKYSLYIKTMSYMRQTREAEPCSTCSHKAQRTDPGKSRGMGFF